MVFFLFFSLAYYIASNMHSSQTREFQCIFWVFSQSALNHTALNKHKNKDIKNQSIPVDVLSKMQAFLDYNSPLQFLSVT